LVLAICSLVVNALGAQPALGDESVTGHCVTKQGPVGNPFVDCSGAQLFNIVPPGQTGTYDLPDFAKAKLGEGFPAHTRDQESMYADLIKVAPNLTAAEISPTYYKDASFLADLSKAKRLLGFLPQSAPLHLNLTVDEYLIYCAYLRDIDKKNIPAAIAEAKDKCGISHFSNRLIDNLSGGYRQRVGKCHRVSQAFVNLLNRIATCHNI